MKKNCCVIDVIAKILVLVGALNWGLVGLFNFNLVAAIFGEMNIVSRIVYILVGVSAVGLIIGRCFCKKKCCPEQNKSDSHS